MGDYIPWIVGGLVLAVIVFAMFYHPNSPASSGGSRIFQRDEGIEMLVLPDNPTDRDIQEFDQAIERLAGWKPHFPTPIRTAKMRGGIGD